MAVGLLACHRLRFVRTIFNHISESALPADWIHSMALVMLTVSATGPVLRTFLCLRMKNALEKVWFPPRTDFFVWWSILSVCCSPGTWQHSVNGDSEVCWIKKKYQTKTGFGMFGHTKLWKHAFIRCISTMTAYRLTCTIICYFCVWLWFRCFFRIIVRKVSVTVAQQSQMLDISKHELGYQQ